MLNFNGDEAAKQEFLETRTGFTLGHWGKPYRHVYLTTVAYRLRLEDLVMQANKGRKITFGQRSLIDMAVHCQMMAGVLQTDYRLSVDGKTDEKMAFRDRGKAITQVHYLMQQRQLAEKRLGVIDSASTASGRPDELDDPFASLRDEFDRNMGNTDEEGLDDEGAS